MRLLTNAIQLLVAALFIYLGWGIAQCIRNPNGVAEVGNGVEIGRIDAELDSLSIRSVNDKLVILMPPIGISAEAVLGPTLCRMLDSPAMLSELHCALSEGMDRASLSSYYAMDVEGGSISISSSDDSVIVWLWDGRRTATIYTTPEKVRKLSNELASFILRYGGEGTVRTPAPQSSW